MREKIKISFLKKQKYLFFSWNQFFTIFSLKLVFFSEWTKYGFLMSWISLILSMLFLKMSFHCLYNWTEISISETFPKNTSFGLVLCLYTEPIRMDIGQLLYQYIIDFILLQIAIISDTFVSKYIFIIH